MTVLFATMGYTAPLVVAPLRQYPGIREMHLFYGVSKDQKHPETLRAVRGVSETFQVKLHEHKLRNGFDFEEALRSYVKTLNTVPDAAKVIFNASSGPRPMIMAATIFCSTHDIPLHYYDEYDTSEGKVIPIKAYRGLRGLGETKKQLLQRLQRDGPLDISTLAGGLELAMSTVSAHVNELLGLGLVHTSREGKRQLVKLEPGVAVLDLEAVA
ncbi:MAG: ArsR family transcriptional regulator [Candidatus Thermoplasmatota archaeon]